MVWNNNIIDLEHWYVQCPRDWTKGFIVYILRKFHSDAMYSCIWIRVPYEREWIQYKSLYFSNGVIGVYDPSNAQYGNMLRIEFEDPLEVLKIECGLCFSFLNQFDLGIENEEVIAGIEKVAKIKQ